MRIDFSGAEIVDIRSNIDMIDGYTKIVLYVKADAKYMNSEYFERTNRSKTLDPNFEWITAEDIDMLSSESLEICDIRQYGGSYSEIRNGMSDVQIEILWYELDKQREDNVNLIFSTWIPRRVKLSMSIDP